MSDSIDQLREMKAKLDLKWGKLQAQIVAVGTERDEIDTAIRVLERLHGQAAPQETTITNENGVLILKYLGLGEGEAQAPKEIQERIVADGHDLNPDLVRTQLWRMAKRGLLESDNGKYWKPVGAQPDQQDEAEPNPFTDYTPPPTFGERVLGKFDGDLDDDVPF